MASKVIFDVRVLLVIILVQSLAFLGHGQLTVPLVDVSSHSTCPVTEKHRSNLRRDVTNILHKLLIPECGDGLWYRVAYLNMTDPSQQCPPAWREYNTSGIRACGRPVSSSGSYPATLYPTNQQYSRVCGRVIGYQFGTPDGFSHFSVNEVSLDQGYMDGISITYGEPRHHIWSYVAGVHETNPNINNCPCSIPPGRMTSVNIGSNYYCESGNPTDSLPRQIFSNDPLWDGEQCEGTCCSGSKSPPWFRVQLPTHTTDRIEVRICGDESTRNEDTPVQLLEIYVQWEVYVQ